MSWVDAISDALGAVGAYMPQMDRMQREREQLALDQKRQQQLIQAQEFEQLAKSIVPGQQIDETLMPKIIQYGLKGRVTKGPNGEPVWADSLEDIANRRQAERESQLTKNAEMEGKITARQLQLREQIGKDPTAFFQQPYEQQSLMWAEAGFPGRPEMSFNEFDRREKSRDWTSLITSQMRTGQQQQLDPLEQARAMQVQLDTYLKMAGGNPDWGAKSIKDPVKRKWYEDQVQALMQKQAGGAPAVAPTSSTGNVTLKAPDGTVMEVPASLASHYISKGAVRVQ